MEGLKGNPHYQSAAYHSDGDEFDQRRSLAEATLALAFEQRTANLIALMCSNKVSTKRATELRDEILYRLGLAEVSE
jgi:hypothetical protein